MSTYVCVRVCACVCGVCVYVRVILRTDPPCEAQKPAVNKYVEQVCICNEQICIYVYIYMYICLYILIYIYIDVYIYICMYTCINNIIYIHTHIHML